MPIEARTVTIGKNKITIEDIADISCRKASVRINRNKEYIDNIEAGAGFLSEILKKEGTIYGVTTGYGDSCTQEIPARYIEMLPVNLTRFHGCGMGRYFTEEQTRAILAVRLTSIACGFSGVTFKLLESIEACLQHDILPLIPEEGSVGASGDLTPLSYVAAALIGERKVRYKGEIVDAAKALESAGIEPLRLKPKEGLAVMNGTAVMTAIACEAYRRAAYLGKLSARITAMTSAGLLGNAYHFNEKLFEVKPHAGQVQAAKWIREDLGGIDNGKSYARLQDRYSVRCAPHIIGVLLDALPFMRNIIENELNSTNDNPIIDGVNRQIYHGGHFYGGHIAFVMDSLKNCVANLADMLDRQMALLVDVKFNHGLPANLCGLTGPESVISHGLKAVQIAASAWTAEALKQTMPASVFSRSTECHNQDKVSMGTIAARDCLRVLELTEQTAAAMLLASVQALSIRFNKNEIDRQRLSPSVLETHAAVTKIFGYLAEDRPLESTLREIVARIQKEHWPMYE